MQVRALKSASPAGPEILARIVLGEGIEVRDLRAIATRHTQYLVCGDGAGLSGLFWDVDATNALTCADVGANRSVIGKLIGGQILRSRFHNDAPIPPRRRSPSRMRP